MKARRRSRLRWCVVIGFVAGFGLRLRPANGFPWSTDMFRGQFIRPLELTPRNQPAGTLTEHAIDPMPAEEAATRLSNPLSTTPQIVGKGRNLFLTDCAPCHGRDGKGDGSVLEVLMVPPADLRSGQPTALSDGYIFSVIREGAKAMPPYGDTLSAEETWQVVTYVRYLQGRSDGQPQNLSGKP